MHTMSMRSSCQATTSSIHSHRRSSSSLLLQQRSRALLVKASVHHNHQNSPVHSTRDVASQDAGVQKQQTRQDNAPGAAIAAATTKLLQQAGHLAVAASLVLSSPGAAVAEGGEGGSTLLRLPASDVPEVFQAQQTMFEAWSIVGDSFVDDSFNGHWWPDELKAHMMAAYATHDGQSAYKEIGDMLGDLGDPYTRIIPPNEYADFRVSSDGELQGVGLLIANEPVNKHLLVLSAIKGGPADRAGITTGDEVISINDQPTEGWTGDMAAKLLRGKGGTEVRVKFARRTSGIPGVAGRPEPRYDDDTTVKEVRLRREKVALSPVYYTALQSDAIQAGPAAGFSLASSSLPPAPPLSDNNTNSSSSSSSSSAASASLGSSNNALNRRISNTSVNSRGGAHTPLATAQGGGALTDAVASVAASASPSIMQRQQGGGVGGGSGSGVASVGPRWGYLRLTSFSQNAAEETKLAIESLERKGVSGYILDLRDNPGGLVKAGMDIARLLLDGHPTVFSIVGRAGEAEQKVVLGEGDSDEVGSLFDDTQQQQQQQAITHKPLVVLVNKHSASASEILSGALHDNGRAMLIGDTPTFGKGRIQSVYELRDGSALFVTVAMYVTPDGTVIDKKGIRPDTSCSLGSGPSSSSSTSPAANSAADSAGMLALAASFVPGMPVGVGAEEALVSALSTDPCVLKAAAVLQDKAAVPVGRSTAAMASMLPHLF